MQARFTLGPIQNPIRGLLHGSAAVLWTIGTWVLWHSAEGSELARMSLAVCAASQIGLYAVSTLYHCVPWDPLAKRRMQRIDHSMIFAKIAGSLTPILVLGLDDWRRAALLSAVWAIAAAGVLQKLCIEMPERASIPLQGLQASLALPALAPFSVRFPGDPVALFVLGLALYSAGTLAFLTQRPRLWPRIFSFHEVFHVFVVAGSGAHYVLLSQLLTRVP